MENYRKEVSTGDGEWENNAHVRHSQVQTKPGFLPPNQEDAKYHIQITI